MVNGVGFINVADYNVDAGAGVELVFKIVLPAFGWLMR